MAKKTGYKPSVIQKFEQGTYFSWPCLSQVAKMLDVQPEDDLLVSSPPHIPEPDSGPDAEPVATPDRFLKLLLELNKELVRDPDLWGVYDLDQEPHPTPDIKQGDRQLQGKLHAFAYMFLNVFQTVYAFYEAQGKRGVRDAHYNSWYGTFKDFVNKSSWAQRILSRKDSEVVYDAGFLAFAKSLIEN